MTPIYSTFLVPDASFATGMGSVANIAGNYYEFNTSETPTLADIRALRADWAQVGHDLAHVLRCESASLGKLPGTTREQKVATCAE